MKSFDKLLEILPDLIREGSKTQLSILALGMSSIAILAYFIIQDPSKQTPVSVIIFLSLLAFVVFLGYSILNASPTGTDSSETATVTEPDPETKPASDSEFDTIEKPPKPDKVLRPLVAILNLKNQSGREEHEPQCFGAGSYLRRVLEAIPSSYRFGVVPNSELVGIHRDGLSAGEILKETGAEFLLEGSLDLRGDPIRIDVHLSLTSGDNNEIWSHTYIEPLSNIQSAIKSIAATVVEKTLARSMQSSDSEHGDMIKEITDTINKVPEQSVEVFEAFNRGIYNQNQFNNLRKDEYFHEAAFQLKESINKSSSKYLDALAQLGFLYILKWETSSEDRWLEKSGDKWNEILEKDPNNPFAMVELAYVSMVNGSRNAVESVTLARRAADLSPDDPIAHNVLALLYLYLGYYESCIKMEENKVFTVTPTYIYPLANAALAQQLRGYHDKALKLAVKAQNIEPESFISSLMIGAQHFYKGNMQEAERSWVEGRKNCTRDIASLFDVTQAWIRAREGDMKSAEKTIAENRNAPWLQGPYGPYYISLCALAGEEELAINMLENEMTFTRNYRYLVSEPTLHPLKKHPQFKSLLERRYEEWENNYQELKAGLTNPVDAYLPAPDDFVK